MLITTCAHCRARFRVTPQQLNARQGQVRCGSCEKVFNGFEALERFPDDDTGGRLLAAAEADERAQREAVADVRPLPDDDMPEIESIGEPLPPPAFREESPPAPQPPPPALTSSAGELRRAGAGSAAYSAYSPS
jgi:predicted Zn finger-like uncharacterized protein